MSTYFSTFISGLNEVVETTLKNEVESIKTELLLDGLILYQTNADIEKIKSFRFLNNSFLLLRLFKNLSQNPIREMTKRVIQHPEILRLVPSFIQKRRQTFRVIFSKENQLISIDNKLRIRLEEIIAEFSSLILNRTNPDYEFWFLERSEGYGFFGIRLTHKPNYEKVLERGELRPELANILCLISEPNKEDKFLDPFAGSGAIPIERAIAFPYKQIFAGDKNWKIVKKLKTRTKKSAPKINVYRGDALNLMDFKSESIDKIVTDPPWGLYCGKNLNLNQFYLAMFKEFQRLLTKSGLLIILTSQKQLLENTLEKFFNQLALLEEYRILVSGQKATIYKITKQ